MMDQTPAHEHHNPDLLHSIPTDAQRLIEIGCSTGALAREFKKLAPTSNYLGIEIDPDYAVLSRRHCDDCRVLNIEDADEAFWQSVKDRDCWIFGDVLEHLKDPWNILRKIRQVIPASGTVVACIPNVQHWSIQVRLGIGAFHYEPAGLMDKTHLRWFTRQTIATLFRDTGFRISVGMPRTFNEPAREKFLPIIANLAEAAGADPKKAVADALPLQYIVKAVPN